MTFLRGAPQLRIRRKGLMTPGRLWVFTFIGATRAMFAAYTKVESMAFPLPIAGKQCEMDEPPEIPRKLRF